ncbi:hypothetical protein [Desulfatitalea tepidiphila]|uniref:hypothetical protein n=1 Tax=Desulfatitalea tepidiphila TaxID=1185843 RepID=UPI0013793705|nr:hypothetical protein [Desulfatitalea tepidiphila]
MGSRKEWREEEIKDIVKKTVEKLFKDQIKKRLDEIERRLDSLEDAYDMVIDGK